MSEDHTGEYGNKVNILALQKGKRGEAGEERRYNIKAAVAMLGLLFLLDL